MTSRISAYIHAKLEIILAAITGASTLAFDIPTMLIKLILAFILGGVGALGGHTVKVLIAKYRKK